MPWDGDLSLWKKHLQKRYQSVCDEAASRLASKGLVRRDQVVAEVRLMRASAQGPLLPAIVVTMRRAEVTVFDLASRPCQKFGNANVLIELGIAIGLGKEPFIVRSSDPLQPNEPSDLAGLVVHRAGSGQFDRSFRSKLCQRVISEWQRSNRLLAQEITRA